MSLVITTQLTKTYGPHDIFAGLNLSLPQGARVGLVGPNGAGKTTLLRLLAGLEEPSRGTVQKAKGVRLGYLPQEAALYAEGNLWEEMLAAFAPLRACEAELQTLEHALAAPDADAALLERYGALQHQFEVDGGYDYENKIQRVLNGLGFSEADYQLPVTLLSGGQKTRALLGRLLLESPDLLILDEPTNHLDIRAVEWLETWINEWPGAALIVSHDRYFLDQTVNVVWELAWGRVEDYRGNYSAYLLQRDERHARQREEYEAQQAFIAKEQDFIRRNMAGQNTRQAKGRLRRLERMLGGPSNKISDASKGGTGAEGPTLVARPVEQSTLKLTLNTSLRSGDRVIETEAIKVGYTDRPDVPGKELFTAPDLLLWREECAALIGPNGAGKTTFLKTLLGDLPPLAGKVKLGSSLRVGYFAQAHERLNAANTVLAELQTARDMPLGQARDYLAKFLFTGDDVFKSVSVLSGGERGRLALAKLALEGANLLLLDEPTNHLDIPSQEILEAVLSDFPGTILLVSHDRYLIEALATQIWILENGQLIIFKGSWSEYIAARKASAEPAPETPAGGKGKILVAKAAPKGAAKSPVAKTIPAKPLSPDAALKQQKAQERKRAARLSELETLITGLEQRLSEIARDLDDAGARGEIDRARALGEEYVQVETDLNAHLSTWEALAA